MTFDDILVQVMTLLKRQGRVSYRALKMRFDNIDDEFLEVLKEELLYVYESEVQADDRGFTWTGDSELIDVARNPAELPEPAAELGQAQPTLSDTTPVEPTMPEAERRQLTVMFCDLVGSTRLSTDLDPEDLRDVIRAYQSTCTEAIQRYEGHVAQLLGDGLLVYFGYPRAHEDSAQRAVRAGMDILTEMGTLNARLEPDHGLRLSVRLGIHTGLVVIGEMGGAGRQEQLALGETPNIAARLQGLAEPDTIVISEATLRLVQERFACEALGEHDLKGLSEPVLVHRVVQERGVEDQSHGDRPRRITPLVGRQSELQLLMERWHQATTGEGQAVLLTAEPGLGKSRMIQSLREALAGEAYSRLECRSSPYYQNTALYPLIDLMQRTLGWSATGSDRDKLGRLEQVLSQYSRPLEEAVPLLADLLSLPYPADRYPALQLSPQQHRQKTLETIVALVVELAGRQPVLFIVEDLHWADPTTVAVLGLLIDQVPTSPLLMLLTCRPEFEAAWGVRSYLTYLTLNRLSHDDIEHLLHRLTQNKRLPPGLLQQLVEKTDGVPLFIEELTKSLLESGLVKEREDHYEWVHADTSLSVPTTLQDSLMARLDRLPTAKPVAQQAAVIGRQFSYELLCAVSPLDEVGLQLELSRLVEAELIFQRGQIPQATYWFKHALIQDTAYDSLLRATRQQVHRQIAQTLEHASGAEGERQPELLAHHYLYGEDWASAFTYLVQAGDQARQAFANSEAIAFYTQALETSHCITPTLDATQVLPVYEGRGLVWTLLTQYDDAIADFEKMRQAAQDAEQSQKEGESLCHLSFAHWLKFSEAELPFIERYAQEALDIARETGDQKTHARALISLGFVPQVRGDLDESDRYHAAALEISRHEGYPDTRASSLLWLSAHSYWRGDFTRAQQLGRESLTTARDIQDGMTELLSLAFLSTTCWSAGDYDQALQLVHDGKAAADERDNLFLGGRMLNTLGWYYREFGAAGEAFTYDQESLERGRASGVSNVETSALINLGLDHLSLAQYDQALSLFTSTLDRVENDLLGTERWRWRVRLRMGLAQVHHLMNRADSALEHVEAALQEAQRTSSRKYIALAWALRGNILNKLGEPDPAGVDLRRAVELAEHLQSPSLIYPMAYDLGQWCAANGIDQEAAARVQQSHAIIDQMAAAIGDETLRATFLQVPLVQEIQEHSTRLGRE